MLRLLRGKEKLPFGGGPGHAGLPEAGPEFLQGPVAAQVALVVRVEALLDPDVRPGLPPQVFGRLGEPGSLSAQRAALHLFTLFNDCWRLLLLFLLFLLLLLLLLFNQRGSLRV